MKEEYTKPIAEELIMSSVNLICSSPNPGENEDIQYEDWSIWWQRLSYSTFTE